MDQMSNYHHLSPEERVRRISGKRIATTGAGELVAESGASSLEPNGGALMIEMLREYICFTVLCVSDPYAVLGMHTAFGNQLSANLVCGPATNTEAAVSLVKKLSGLPALNLLDRANHPGLTEMLRLSLKSRKL